MTLDQKEIDHLHDLNIQSENLILDIDLDYFSSKNPIPKFLFREFKNKITMNQIKEFSKLYNFENFNTATEEYDKLHEGNYILKKD